jgi:hypothetical protein
MVRCRDSVEQAAKVTTKVVNASNTNIRKKEFWGNESERDSIGISISHPESNLTARKVGFSAITVSLAWSERNIYVQRDAFFQQIDQPRVHVAVLIWDA